MNTTERLLRKHEGVRPNKYWDPIGKVWTIGVGHNLGSQAPWTSPPLASVALLQRQANLPEDDQWLPEAIELQLTHDVWVNCAWLWQKPWWNSAGDARQAALNDMAFNLGEARDEKFVTFFGLVAVGDWEAAAADLVSNTQMQPGHPLHARYADLARILETGSTAGVLPDA